MLLALSVHYVAIKHECGQGESIFSGHCLMLLTDTDRPLWKAEAVCNFQKYQKENLLMYSSCHPGRSLTPCSLAGGLSYSVCCPAPFVSLGCRTWLSLLCELVEFLFQCTLHVLIRLEIAITSEIPSWDSCFRAWQSLPPLPHVCSRDNTASPSSPPTVQVRCDRGRGNRREQTTVIPG